MSQLWDDIHGQPWVDTDMSQPGADTDMSQPWADTDMVQPWADTDMGQPGADTYKSAATTGRAQGCFCLWKDVTFWIGGPYLGPYGPHYHIYGPASG